MNRITQAFHSSRQMWPSRDWAPLELYLERVDAAGGWKKYEQAHVARIAAILETPLLPPELVRKVLEFWLHAGYY